MPKIGKVYIGRSQIWLCDTLFMGGLVFVAFFLEVLLSKGAGPVNILLLLDWMQIIQTWSPSRQVLQMKSDQFKNICSSVYVGLHAFPAILVICDNSYGKYNFVIFFYLMCLFSIASHFCALNHSSRCVSTLVCLLHAKKNENCLLHAVNILSQKWTCQWYSMRSNDSACSNVLDIEDFFWISAWLIFVHHGIWSTFFYNVTISQLSFIFLTYFSLVFQP